MSNLIKFDTLLEQIHSFKDLQEWTSYLRWMELISKYYLSPKEQTVLMLMLHNNSLNKGQREFAVLCGIYPEYISVLFKKIKTKLGVIYNYLSDSNIEMQYYQIRNVKKKTWERYFPYVMAGVTRPTLAKYYKKPIGTIETGIGRMIESIHKTFPNFDTTYNFLLAYRKHYLL